MDQLRVFMRSNTTEKEVLFLSIEHGYHTCVRRILPTSRYLVISVSKSRQYFRSFWRSVVRPLALFLLMVSLHSRSSQHCRHNTPLDYFQHLHKHWYIHTHTHTHTCTDKHTHTLRNTCTNVLPHPVTVYWHWADQSQCWPYNARHLAR